MIQTKPISKTITSLDDLEERFNLRATENEQFFPEWNQELPELADIETATLDQSIAPDWQSIGDLLDLSIHVTKS
jgi:hypothetical protein